MNTIQQLRASLEKTRDYLGDAKGAATSATTLLPTQLAVLEIADALTLLDRLEAEEGETYEQGHFDGMRAARRQMKTTPPTAQQLKDDPTT